MVWWLAFFRMRTQGYTNLARGIFIFVLLANNYSYSLGVVVDGLIATYVASCSSSVGDVANVLEGEWW